MTALAERAAQIDWVLDHLADLDADFLAIYGLDLETYEISGPRYFALAYRLPAYQGVMAARIEAEKDEPQSAGSGRAVEQQTRAGSNSETKEVSLTAFRVMFPGLVSSSTIGQEE